MSTHHLRRSGCVLFLSLFLTVGSLEATVLIPADLGDLAREAGTIARGVVVAVEPRWLEDRRAIETIVTLQTEVYLKGSLGPLVQFRVPGGRMGRFRSVTIGAPAFEAGQRVVVFLNGAGPRLPDIVGLSQGVFRLSRGTNAWTVAPQSLAGVTDPRPGSGAPGRRVMPLAEFEAHVRHLGSSRR
jgi:hypothetical protein